VKGDFQPNEKLAIALGATYTISDGEFESIMTELPEEVVDIGDYDFSQVHTLSDLEYRQLEASVKADRQISDRASFYVGVSLFELLDEAPYVYGDLDGRVIYTHSGFRIGF
jgi:hypothetical protein